MANHCSRGAWSQTTLLKRYPRIDAGLIESAGIRAELVDAMDGLVRDAVIIGEERGTLLILSERARMMAASGLSAGLLERLGRAARFATGSANRIGHASTLTCEPSLDRGERAKKGSLYQCAMRANHPAVTSAL